MACMWDLVPQPGIEPGPPALGVRSRTHWTTREVPVAFSNLHFLIGGSSLEWGALRQIKDTPEGVGDLSHPNRKGSTES